MEGVLTPNTALILQQASQQEDAGKSLKAEKNADRIKNAAQEFEAVFLSEMLKPMFEGIETDEMFGGGKGEEIFRSMMIDEYGKQIADKNITGIQTQVMNKMIELQAQRTAEAMAPTSPNNSLITDADLTEE